MSPCLGRTLLCVVLLGSTSASAARPEEDLRELKRADDFISAFAASYGLTPEQFDARVGYPHEKLVSWTAGLLNVDPRKYSASERLAYVANLDEPSATVPGLAKMPRYRPQISLTASELSMRFDGAPAQAINDLGGRIAIINGKISGKPLFGLFDMPPRIRVFDGFLVGYTKSQGLQTGPRFRSFPQYYLGEDQVRRFSALREGDAVTMICQIGGDYSALLNKVSPDLTNCLLATPDAEETKAVDKGIPENQNKPFLTQRQLAELNAKKAAVEAKKPAPSATMSDAGFKNPVQTRAQAIDARKVLELATTTDQCISLVRVAAMADAYVRQCGQRPGVSQAAMDHYSRSNCARIATADEINVTRKQIEFDSVSDFNREGAQAYCREASEFFADKAALYGIN